MASNFSRSSHTIIVSDIHLADAEPPHPRNPLWKRYKRPKLFVDRSFKRFLEYLRAEIDGPIELIMNGDIFDFDSVMVFPKSKKIHVSWLERKRGLFAEEEKSRFKMGIILRDHKIWVEALREFILAGNRIVFVIGNHDMELHWPSVQEEVMRHLDLPKSHRDAVRFCEFFYVSNEDTLIEHGNQYDEYSLCSNPIHPLIKKGSRIYVRLPFGNLANKFMLNGMGLFNPHVDGSYIKESFKEYVVFFYKYIVRTQPLLMWTWFWGAMMTLFYSISEGLMPAMRDPLTVENRVEEIATKSNADPKIVRSLLALSVHPAYFKPLKILRELWLDRALLMLLILAGSFWFFSTLNVFVRVSYWWFWGPVGLTFPLFVFYAQSVESEVAKAQESAERNAPIAAQIAHVERVVHGHTHREKHVFLQGVEYLNTGTWSPAYKDVECTQYIGRKCFAWIRPRGRGGSSGGGGREAALYAWLDPGIEEITPK